MPRARFFALAALPLLATLLAAQPGMAQFNPFQLLTPQPAKPEPAKPGPQAQQKKPAPNSWHPKPAPAAAQKKPEAKKPEAKKPEPKKPEAQKLEAKKPDAKKLEAKKPAPPKYELSDYYKVWDVTAGTTRKDIVARFGEPRQPADRRVSYYFNENLAFFFTGDDTVGTMVVGNSFEPMPPNSIPPDVIAKAFIGRSRDDVLKTFGPANAVLSDNYRYLPKAGPYKVQFQCYDIERYVCRQMMVQF
jgi:hypothetical protein